MTLKSALATYKCSIDRGAPDIRPLEDALVRDDKDEHGYGSYPRGGAGAAKLATPQQATSPKKEWYATLTPETREKLFAEMRSIDKDAQSYMQKGRDLSPRGGAIAVGGAHFEQTLKGEVISSYLRALRNGAEPKDALAKAETDRSSYVKTWNTQHSKDYVLQRADTAEQSLLEGIHRRVLAAVK